MKRRFDNSSALPWTKNGALRWVAPLLLVLCFHCTVLAAEEPEHAVAPGVSQASPAIAIGFVGGFVHPDDMRHAEVELARRLSQLYGSRIHSAIFDNHHRQDAYLAIHRWLDADADGDLSDAERQASRIIIYGHSWGATAVLQLARELQRENIPVLLTVQVDSIGKMGQDDHTVPANVAKAVNFYQTRGLLHGRTQISPADPSRTQILGQFRFDYTKMPSACHDYPWLDRHLFKGHTSIECDPQVWSQVRDFIDAALFSKLPESANSGVKSLTPQPDASGTSNFVQQLLPTQLTQR